MFSTTPLNLLEHMDHTPWLLFKFSIVPSKGWFTNNGSFPDNHTRIYHGQHWAPISCHVQCSKHYAYHLLQMPNTRLKEKIEPRWQDQNVAWALREIRYVQEDQSCYGCCLCYCLHVVWCSTARFVLYTCWVLAEGRKEKPSWRRLPYSNRGVCTSTSEPNAIRWIVDRVNSEAVVPIDLDGLFRRVVLSKTYLITMKEALHVCLWCYLCFHGGGMGNNTEKRLKQSESTDASLKRASRWWWQVLDTGRVTLQIHYPPCARTL